MELGELKAFVTVATEHSFSRAAIKLCRTQPAVSQAIRRLEEDLGERLVRSQHEVREARRRQAMRCCPKRSNCSEWPTKQWPRSGSCRSGTARSCGLAATNPTLTSCSRRCRYSSLQQPHVSVEFRRVADLDVLAEVGAGTIDIGITTRERVPAPLCSVPVPVLSTGFCVLLPKSHPFASWPELPMTVLHSERLVTLAGLPLPESVTMRATDDAAPPTGVFVVMPGVDSLKHAVANGLGIGIVPRAAVSSLTALPDWSRSPCRRRGQPARARSCIATTTDNELLSRTSSRPCGARARTAPREKPRSP